MITVRPAMRLDAPSMAKLLNEIVAQGGTTAIVRPVTGDDITEWMNDIELRRDFSHIENRQISTIRFLPSDTPS